MRSTILILILLGTCTSTLLGLSRSYIETVGKESYSVLASETKLSDKDGYRMEYRAHFKHEIWELDTHFNTQSWVVSNNLTQEHYRIHRNQNKLIVTGRVRERTFNAESQSITADPWYQALEPAARRFAQSDRRSQAFWILLPDTLSLHHMILKDRKAVKLLSGDVELDAVQVRVTFLGWRQYFWSAYYWFRESDGVWLRYEGTNGPPGTPKTTITLSANQN